MISQNSVCLSKSFKEIKICYIASSGGHWEELMCLRDLFNQYECLFVTEDGGQAYDSKLSPLYTFPQINRHEKQFILHLFRLFRNAKKIIDENKPDVIATTGALLAFPFCVIGKVRHCKIIYIESFARVNKPSLTGRLCYPISDLFLVQWKDLTKYYKKAKYVGGIF